MNCDIIQDLLILYDDGACSEATRTAVEAHLATCESCRSRRNSALLPPLPEPKQETKAVKRSFRKVRRRWIASILAVLMIAPLIFLGFGIRNEINKEGLCFSNLDEVWACRRFLSLVADGKYAEAAECADFSEDYADIQEALSWTLEDYLPTYECVVICDESFWATTYFYNRYLLDTAENGLDLWAYFIYNDTDRILIPEGKFQEFTGQTADTQMADGHYACTLEDADLTYHLLETQWVRYMVGPTTWADLADREMASAADFCNFLILVPNAIYEEAKDTLYNDAALHFAWNQAYYSDLVGISEAEYDALMEESYASNLQDLFDQGISIENFKMDTAYQIEGSWRVVYAVTFRVPVGDTHRMNLEFAVGANGIYLISGSYIEESPWHDAIFDAFVMRYDG